MYTKAINPHTGEVEGIIRSSDGAQIPLTEKNRDFRIYNKLVKERKTEDLKVKPG